MGCGPRAAKAEFDSEIESPAFEGRPVLEVERIIEASDVVMVTGLGRGHHREAGAFRFAYSDLFTFRGDLIAQVDSYVVPLGAFADHTDHAEHADRAGATGERDLP